MLASYQSRWVIGCQYPWCACAACQPRGDRHRDDVLAEIQLLLHALDDVQQIVHRLLREDVHAHVHVHVAIVQGAAVILAHRHLLQLVQARLLAEAPYGTLHVPSRLGVHGAHPDVSGVHLTEPALGDRDGNVRTALVVCLEHVPVVHAVERLAAQDEIRLGLGDTVRAAKRASLEVSADAISRAEGPVLLLRGLERRENVAEPAREQEEGG